MFFKKKSKEELKGIYKEAIDSYNNDNFKKAIRKFKCILKNVRNDPHSNHYVGLCYGKLYDFKKADKHFDKSIKYGEDAFVWFNKGLTIFYSNYKKDKRKYERSLEAIKKAILIDEKNAEFWYYKGLISSKLHRTKKAKEAFKKCLKIDKSFKNMQKNKVFEKLKRGKS